MCVIGIVHGNLHHHGLTVLVSYKYCIIVLVLNTLHCAKYKEKKESKSLSFTDSQPE